MELKEVYVNNDGVVVETDEGKLVIPVEEAKYLADNIADLLS